MADVHDGHGNYLAEVEQELRWISVRRFGEFVLALLAGWTVAYWLYLATGPEKPGTAERVFSFIGLGIVGFVAGLIYLGFIGDLALSRRHRKKLTISCIAAFALGVACPMYYRGHAKEAAAEHWRSDSALETYYGQEFGVERRDLR